MKWIKVQTRFEGYHRWKDAPEDVEFLRNTHRHIFHVKLQIEVEKNNRELEFIRVKDWLNEMLDRVAVGERSCEDLCELILKSTKDKYGDRKVKVEVSEDGENGAIVER